MNKKDKPKVLVKEKKIAEPKVVEIKKEVSTFGALMHPAKFRLLKSRYKLKDDDLITEKEFEANKEKMYGKE